MYSSSSQPKKKVGYLALTLFFLPNPIPTPKLKLLLPLLFEVGESAGIGGIGGLDVEIVGREGGMYDVDVGVGNVGVGRVSALLIVAC